MKRPVKFVGLILILFLSYWAIRPFFQPGFFPMHDDTQVARVFEMAKALGDGQFPVRWVPDLGYGFGYPIFNFYSPLPYYFGAFFVLLGFDALLATKIMFALGILIAGIFIYFLSREFWGEVGGLVSGLFLIYAPYHAVQIYVRGAVDEFWALAFVPLAMWGIYKVTAEVKWRWVLVGSLGYAGIILSHNITAMIFSLFLVPLFLVFLYRSLRTKNLSISYYLSSIIFFGLSLSAFFWLPALWEAKYVDVGGLVAGTNNFRLHFLCPGQLWDSAWGFGGSAPGCMADGLSFKIGKLHILMAALAFLLTLWKWGKDRFRNKTVLLTTFYLLLSTFMTQELSKPVWEVFQPLAYVQYPWRFLSFIILAASFLAGAVIWQFKNKWLKAFLVLLSIFILLFYNIKYFQPQIQLEVNANYYTNEEALKWRTSKISDEYLPKIFTRPQNEKELASVMNTWSNQEYNFKANTPVRVLANIISLLALVFIIGVSFHARKKEN